MGYYCFIDCQKKEKGLGFYVAFQYKSIFQAKGCWGGVHFSF